MRTLEEQYKLLEELLSEARKRKSAGEREWLEFKTNIGESHRSITYEGVGSVDIVMKQSGKKLHVVRNLSLEQSIVPVTDYAKYRQLLTIWQGAESILLQSK